jgi:hypothetical protein
MTSGRGRRRAVLAALVVAAVSLAGCTWVKQASHAAGGSADGDAPSTNPALDLAGNYVVFQSDATNLVPGDTNGVTDAFKVGTTNDHVERISVAPDGSQANGASRNPSIDCCGGYVVFESDASNLVAGDTNGTSDVFVRNMSTKVTTLVSVASDGGPADGPSTHPVISSDDRYVAFESTADDIVPGVSGHQVYVRALQTNAPAQLVSTAACTGGAVTGANGVSTGPHISDDGSTVAFTSTSTNLGTDPGNGAPNAFVAPTAACVVPTLVGLDPAGHVIPSGSVATSVDKDGTVVAFDPNGAPGVYVRDLPSGVTRAVDGSDPYASGGTLSGDGLTVGIQASGPSPSTSPVAAVYRVPTGARLAASTDASGDSRTIVPGSTVFMTRWSQYFAYVAPGSSDVPQVFEQTMTPIPVVSAVAPATVARGSSGVTLTVSGSKFVSGAYVVVSAPGVTLGATTYVDSTTLRVPITVAPDASTGAINVVVVNPGALGAGYGSAGTCGNCLTVG